MSTWTRGRWCTKCPQKSTIGRLVVRKCQNLVHVVCERPLETHARTFLPLNISAVGSVGPSKIISHYCVLRKAHTRNLSQKKFCNLVRWKLQLISDDTLCEIAKPAALALSITWPLFFRCSAFIVFTLYCLLLLVTWFFAIHTSFNCIFLRQNLQILFIDRITEFKMSAIFFVKINESPMVFQIWFHSFVFFEKHTREICLRRNSAISFDESCN